MRTRVGQFRPNLYKSLSALLYFLWFFTYHFILMCYLCYKICLNSKFSDDYSSTTFFKPSQLTLSYVWSHMSNSRNIYAIKWGRQRSMRVIKPIWWISIRWSRYTTWTSWLNKYMNKWRWTQGRGMISYCLCILTYTLLGL